MTMATRRPKVFAVIAAAGSGIRLGGTTKKQFLLLKEKPILVLTLQRFEHCPDIDEIAIAVPEDEIVGTESLLTHFRLHKVSKVIAGGEKRQDSVWNVLSKLDLKPSDIVLVHDGVRPFIDSKKISQIVNICKEYDAVVLAVQPKDTIRRSNGSGYFDQMLDRNALWLVQTPQGFKASLLLKAFERARKEKFYSTDEAALVERLDVKARIVQGSYDNIKITTEEDLELGKLILERWLAKGVIR